MLQLASHVYGQEWQCACVCVPLRVSFTLRLFAIPHCRLRFVKFRKWFATSEWLCHANLHAVKCPHSHIVIQYGTGKTWDSGKVNVTGESCSSALNPSPALWVTYCVIMYIYLAGKHVQWGLLRRGPYHLVCSCGHFVSKCHLLFSLASVCL